MADISVERKKGGELTWIWAAAAIIAVVALMAWLYSTRELASGPAADAAADSAAADTAGVPAGPAATDLAAIGGMPDQFVGQEVRVEDVAIAAVLGQRGFWAEIPGQNPFLMVVGPEVTDPSWVVAGDTVAIQGTVEPVTEEAVNEWVQSEAIREGASAEASFATHYMAITQAEP